MTQDLGSLARELARPYYADALPAHDTYHAQRVRDLSLRLATECAESPDREVLQTAAWLHDIGRPRERTGDIDDHGTWAATEARALLEDESVAPERIDAIEHCLRAHSIRPSSPDPDTIEAKILFDADKLDAVGARGIVRLACIVGERSGRTGGRYAVIDDAARLEGEAPDCPDIGHIETWARDRLEALWTEPARQLGESRWAFMEAFFTRFDAEAGVDGTR